MIARRLMPRATVPDFRSDLLAGGAARQIVRIEVLLNSPEARIVETVEGDPRILSRNGIAGGIHQRVDALLERSLLGL
ncbi:hypothetical protein [Povalibacter sp.]|uniref:hypothetical protein n=1 Tax=Povalibacter sp. TaxID=1962978 RepID=UPI002D1FA2BA|nr:hypothetical protein [Povalibacter sp.]